MGCAQFIRHAVLWVSLCALEAWGVAYAVFQQQEGDLLVMAPGAYHQGWNAGANIAKAVNWGDGMTQRRLANYRTCRPGCHPDNVRAKAASIITLKWLALPAASELAPPEADEAYFTAMPQQPREKLWSTHDVFGSGASPRMLENLFEDGRAHDAALVWPAPVALFPPFFSPTACTVKTFELMHAYVERSMQVLKGEKMLSQWAASLTDQPIILEQFEQVSWPISAFNAGGEKKQPL